MQRELGKQRSYFSVSSVKAYLKCPQCYKLRYINKVQSKETPEIMLFGGAVHAGLAAMYRGKDYRAAFLDALTRGWENNTVVGKNGAKVSFENSKIEGYTILEIYKEKRYWFGDVTGVEMSGMVDVKHSETGEELPLPMMVKMDLVLTNGIVDHKIKGAPMDRDEAENDIQRTAYWLWFEHTKGREPEFFAYNQIIRLKRVPKIMEPLKLISTKEDKAMFWNICKEALEGIHAGKFPRSDTRWHDFSVCI